MRGLIWVISLAALAVLAALVLHDFHGNVVVLVPPYRLDMGLAAFVLALLLLFAVLMGLLKLLGSVLSLPALAAQYRTRRAEDLARQSLAQAVIEMAAGRFSRAYGAAQSAAYSAALTPAAQLLAAEAAHRLNNHKERDAILASCVHSDSDRIKDAALLLSAQVSLDDRDPGKARAALSQLGSGPARRVKALRLKLEAARAVNDFDEVKRIVPLLHKHGDLSLTAAHTLSEHAALAKLHDARHDLDKLRNAWRELDALSSRSNALLGASRPRLAAAAARLLAALDALPQAKAVLHDAIDAARAEEREPLFIALSEIMLSTQAPGAAETDTQELAKLERWCAQNPRSAAAALAAGAACASRELWGKARVFLKDAVRLDTQASIERKTLGAQAQHACLLLASIEEKLGETDKAMSWYRDAALAKGYLE